MDNTFKVHGVTLRAPVIPHTKYTPSPPKQESVSGSSLKLSETKSYRFIDFLITKIS